jgi:quercetin dioxygenase-like cupin family protein
MTIPNRRENLRRHAPTFDYGSTTTPVPTLRGRVIDNPISGERIVIRTTAEESDGALLAFDLFLPPGGRVPARHVHPVQEERFTVLNGQLRFRLGRRTVLAAPGQTVLVPPRTTHWFGNEGTEPAHARVEVRPALRTAELLETTETLGRSGRTPGTGRPELLDLADLLLEFQRELAMPMVPPVLARAVLRPIAWLGRRRRG